MKSLIDRLERIVQEKGLAGERGQIGLVQYSGASKSVVNQWMERKIKSIGFRYAQELEKNLGFRHTWIMTGEGPVYVDQKQEPTAIVNLEVARVLNELVEITALFRDASDHGRKTILVAARTAAKRKLDDAASSDN